MGVQRQADRLRTQLERARDTTQPDAVDEAAQRLAGLEDRLPELRARRDEVADAEAAITTAAQALQRKVEDCRLEKEVFKSLYTAGEAGAIARDALRAATAATAATEIERLRALLRRHGIDPDEPESA